MNFSRLTYGEEWRERARTGGGLDSDERKRWAEEKEWDAAHPEDVAALDALVGTMVATTRALYTLEDKYLHSESYFLVRARFKDRLLGTLGSASGQRFLLRREWIRQVLVSPARKDARDEQTRRPRGRPRRVDQAEPAGGGGDGHDRSRRTPT